MTQITVTGKLGEISVSLHSLSELIKNREALGFQLFQPDEVWLYEGEGDEKMCPLCRGYMEQTLWNGVDVGNIFPDIRHIDRFLFWPNVHETHPQFKGLCRCRLTLLNPAKTFEQRLHEEKLQVANVSE